ncbi:MAG: alkaline phosphatase family protein [Proteobacteria bacterium]|nr:alkaline phosphatase family protein [Pseudomonadota bacterium]
MIPCKPVLIAALLAMAGPVLAETAKPATPIDHLIVIIGENVSFDTLFGAYRPAAGQNVANLLSRGIIDADGKPGPNYALALQHKVKPAGRYQVEFAETTPYASLPGPWGRTAMGGKHVLDKRMAEELPPGPFQITRYIPYGTFTGQNPVHRFFQMWQQVNGGRNNLFTWVGVTSGEGSKRKSDPSSGSNLGGEAMGFYNMSRGDVPVLAELASRYALADNYHQSIMGGTMANYIAIITGDVARYLHDGKPTPPSPGEIENPEPLAGSANWYTHSGYDSGSYTACADPSQPGVAAIRAYLKTLTYPTFNDGNCTPETYYLVNNFNPGYAHDGRAKPFKPNANSQTVPPQTTPTIVEALSARNIAWKWYSGGRDGGRVTGEYCNVCDAPTFFKGVMETPLKANLQGHKELHADIEQGRMPAVSFVVPPDSKSGHPGGSTPPAFEGFVADIVRITTDEGGGYYDSGYIQAIDFFGDGTRIPFLAISPWARPGHVEHTYYDHASLLKFIERNWGLQPLSSRSRDNLPNPRPGADPYIPANRPAVGDLFELFDFASRKL